MSQGQDVVPRTLHFFRFQFAVISKHSANARDLGPAASAPSPSQVSTEDYS